MEVSSADAGAVGTMTCGVLRTGMHGHIKADNDNVGANVRMWELHGAGDRCRRRVVGMWECMGMEKSRCV